MAEELAFRLSIEGAEQELRNIEDLRQAVRQLEENLETADFGSEAFKRAEKELKAARGELYKFDRQLEARARSLWRWALGCWPSRSSSP
jgi:DNA repair exonuclease SbcCD ATPase subunit